MSGKGNASFARCELANVDLPAAKRAIDSDRLLDVLELLRTEVRKGYGQFSCGGVADRRGHDDTARLRDSFEASCDIDGRPEQVAIPFQDIAKVDAYTCPELPAEALVERHLLKSQGAIHGLQGTCKLSKDAITGRVGDATSILSHQLFGCPTHGAESDKCSRLIGFHQA